MEEKRRFIAIACFEIAIFSGGYGAGIMFPNPPVLFCFAIFIAFIFAAWFIWPKSGKVNNDDIMFDDGKRKPSGKRRNILGEMFPKDTLEVTGIMLAFFLLIVGVVLLMGLLKALFNFMGI